MHDLKIDIWNGFDYRGTGERPYLKAFLTDAQAGAVLIIPGGGYGWVSPREGEPVARQYNARGFHAFVLQYSVAPNRHPQPVADAARAMCIIRENAGKWNVNSDKIAVCGFSAGGHLAASLGVFCHERWLTDIDGITEGLTEPSSLILSYPVISSGQFAHRGSFENLLGPAASPENIELMSLEKHVSKKTPRSFLWHTFEDEAVPMENSILFAMALRKAGVPCEMHIYPDGEHGLSLATEETAESKEQINLHVSGWIDLSAEWLKSN